MLHHSLLLQYFFIFLADFFAPLVSFDIWNGCRALRQAKTAHWFVFFFSFPSQLRNLSPHDGRQQRPAEGERPAGCLLWRRLRQKPQGLQLLEKQVGVPDAPLGFICGPLSAAWSHDPYLPAGWWRWLKASWTKERSWTLLSPTRTSSATSCRSLAWMAAQESCLSWPSAPPRETNTSWARSSRKSTWIDAGLLFRHQDTLNLRLITWFWVWSASTNKLWYNPPYRKLFVSLQPRRKSSGAFPAGLLWWEVEALP